MDGSGMGSGCGAQSGWRMGSARGPAQHFREDDPRTLIFSCLRDKPVAEMAQILFPLFDHVIAAADSYGARCVAG